MSFIKEKSSTMLIIVIILVVLLGSGGMYTIHLTNSVRPDARVINNLGVVRGSIQRLLKLECNRFDTDELIDKIDLKISSLKSEKIIENNNLKNSFNELDNSWKELKELIYNNRINYTEENRLKILDLGEKIWYKADDTVLLSQLTSEKKVQGFKVSFIFFIINLILGISIVYLVKRYVKDTLEYLVNYDGLTKIYNRRYFNEFLKNNIEVCEKHNCSLSLIMLDTDNFKNVNDNYGHDIGDYVLVKMCEIIKKNIRKCDIFARLGGEEFVIITPNTDINGARNIGEKIRKVVEEYNFENIETITISLGVSEYFKGDSLDTLYKRADIALYKAKNSGKNKVEIEIKE